MSDYYQALEPVCDVIDIYEGPEVFLSTFSTVRPELGLLYAAHFCQYEICNGGFTQLFFNSTGVLAPEAVKGFVAIGQPRTAAIVQKAMSMLALTYPRERRNRQAALHDLASTTDITARVRGAEGYRRVEAFGPLEDEFYSLLESESGGFEVAANWYTGEIVK